MIGLLVNSHAFERWQSRRSATVSTRMAEVNAMIAASVGDSRRESPVGDARQASPVGDARQASPSSLGDSRQESPTNSAWGEWWGKIKSQAEGGEFQRHGSTAVVEIVGALDYKYDLWSYYYDSSCYKGIMAKVAAAAADTSIDRIVLAIDSPGGIHHGCPEAATAIWDARQSGKEIIAVVDPEAASAGYWMASQANKIVAIESGWVGSLGSQIMLYSMKRMYDEAGFDIEVVRAAISPNKNLGHPYEAISDEAREERQGWVDVAGDQFVDHVARGRSVKREDVLKSYGQGKMFFATQALERGMIDEIASFDSIISGSGKKKTGIYSQVGDSSLESQVGDSRRESPNQSRLRSKYGRNGSVVAGPLGNKSRNSGAL